MLPPHSACPFPCCFSKTQSKFLQCLNLFLLCLCCFLPQICAWLAPPLVSAFVSSKSLPCPPYQMQLPVFPTQGISILLPGYFIYTMCYELLFNFFSCWSVACPQNISSMRIKEISFPERSRCEKCKQKRILHKCCIKDFCPQEACDIVIVMMTGHEHLTLDNIAQLWVIKF